MSRPRLLLTGATGYLGAVLVPRLAARGYELHALVRPSAERAPSEERSSIGAQRSSIGAAPVTWHAGDLLEPDSVARAARAVAALGPFALIHGGALVSYRTRDAELARRVNVEGTRAVLAAAIRSGASRLVHVSSVVAVGALRAPTGVLDEEAAFDDLGVASHYVHTKRAAEELALSAAGELDVVVVNPGVIVGPSPRPANSARFLERARRGALGPLAPPGGVALVGVEDVAEGVVLALERGRRARRYLLTESNWTLLDLCQRAAAEFGARSPRRACPPVAWRGITAAARAWDRLRAAHELAPQALELLGLHYRCDSARARTELGWQPEPFASILRRTCAWIRERAAGSP